MCCERCLAKLRADSKPCANCRGPLLPSPIRNLALENAAARVSVACPNAGIGCAVGPLPFSRAAEHIASVCSRREVLCGHRDRSGNNSCGKAVRLHQFAAHWVEQHECKMRPAKVIERRTKIAKISTWWDFTDAKTAIGTRIGSFSTSSVCPILPPGAAATAAAAAAPPAASCAYKLEIMNLGGQVRMGVRSLGTATAPAGLELRGIVVKVGQEGETASWIFIHLQRPLQPHESLADNSLSLGRSAPVALFAPKMLGKALTGPRAGEEKPWRLDVSVKLRFAAAS